MSFGASAGAGASASGGSESKPVAKPAIEREDNRKDLEKRLFAAIKEGNDEDAIRLVNDPGLRVDAHDDHGLTALEFACYKKNKRVCEALLKRGANVNSHQHEHCYSALMFAALSGDEEITRMMLDAGGDINFMNSVQRTPAQMASFIGLSEIADMITSRGKKR